MCLFSTRQGGKFTGSQGREFSFKEENTVVTTTGQGHLQGRESLEINLEMLKSGIPRAPEEEEKQL